MPNFATCTKGTFAVAFALALVPSIGFVGAAVDYSRANGGREALRNIADAAAIQVVAADAEGTVLDGTRSRVAAELGVQPGDVTIDGDWLDERHYEVTIRVDLATVFLRVVPFMPDSMQIETVAVARRTPPVYRSLPPQRSLLDPEAGDYNRVYMYCFDPVQAREPHAGRSGLTPIADNASPPTDYSNRKLPECGPGEVISYMLRNVRHARKNRNEWDNPNAEVYEYYADATVRSDTQVVSHDVRGFRVYNGNRYDPMDMAASPILETILCDSETRCVPVSQGGDIPNRRTGRTPAVATGACRPGMSMYFGWEDRPPGFGWTDTDYDDIRLVISCPEIEEVASKEVVLVR